MSNVQLVSECVVSFEYGRSKGGLEVDSELVVRELGGKEKRVEMSGDQMVGYSLFGNSVKQREDEVFESVELRVGDVFVADGE